MFMVLANAAHEVDVLEGQVTISIPYLECRNPLIYDEAEILEPSSAALR
jgi:hypothetical protein